MSVICPVCNTENRASAMFCHGCAGKLPAFAATGPSVREQWLSDPTQAPSGSATSAPRARPADTRSLVMPMEQLSFWLRIGGAALIVLLLFLAWFAYVTRRVDPHPAPVALNANASSAAVAEVAAGELARPATPTVPTEAPVTSSKPDPELAMLAPQTPEEVVEAAPKTELQPLPAVPRPQAPPARQASASRAVIPERVAALDPRRGCEGLNFIFADHCEAVHCDEAAYASHPRCAAVRAERRRVEARRNPSLGEQGF